MAARADGRSVPVMIGRPETPTTAYPTGFEADVVLREGSAVHIRPVRAADAAAIADFMRGLSLDSIELRFFGIPNLDWAVSWSIDVDYADRFALVAETGSPSRIVAHAAYIRIDPGRAEVAFLVADAWQGRGIATIMLRRLAEAARQHGILSFVAEVLPANHRMIEVFRDSGFPVSTRSIPGEVDVEIATSRRPGAVLGFPT